MLIDWMRTWSLHGWSAFLITLAVLGLVGAFVLSLGIVTGKGVLGFLGGNRAPQVIVVQGNGRVQLPPKEKHWGMGRWFGLFAGLFSGVPMLVLLGMGLTHAFFGLVTWALAHWLLLPIVGVAVLLVLAFWMLMRRERADAQAERVEFHQTHVAPAVEAAPVVAAPMWSMPEVEGNWREGVR